MGKALFALSLLCCGAALALAAPEEAGPEGGTEAGGAHYKQSNTTKLKRVVIDETKPLSTAMKCCITLLITYFIVQVRVCAPRALTLRAYRPCIAHAHCHPALPVTTLTPSPPRCVASQPPLTCYPGPAVLRASHHSLATARATVCKHVPVPSCPPTSHTHVAFRHPFPCPHCRLH